MLRSSSPRAFTLIEMLTVMLIIAILAGIVLSVNGLVQNRAARARAEGEMKAISSACESYKADFGSYPRNDMTTDVLDARSDFDPSSAKYKDANKSLYVALSGDTLATGKIGTTRDYSNGFFTPAVLNATKDASGVITAVNFIKDPFDNPYGYSTIGVAAEEKFADDVRTKGTQATRSSTAAGYNPSYDLWSTAGAPASATGQAKWVKNW